MVLRKKKGRSYGNEQRDIRTELDACSAANSYRVEHSADCLCTCGARVFTLRLDDTEGAAVRTCVECGVEHPIGDSDDFLEDAELEDCECPCGKNAFEITIGVALYQDSDDVKWLYVGCRCVACGLVACYGDWKNEFQDYTKLLARV